MKITTTKIGAALVLTVGVVAVSASTLITSLNEGSALAIGSMATAARLLGDTTLSTDLPRMTASDREPALSQHGLSSESALATRIGKTREEIHGYLDRQEHIRTVVNYSYGFLYASLMVLPILSVKIAMVPRDKEPSRDDAAHA
ncbi:hypothetical protein B0G80_9070 [Paraburkholderia sp. BL6669N2]|uniref:hypothetical protein n=1 Tax=Paraburkholderia sp. BL6669N2 TaxID=1938807 RepID=UPI000E3A642D|nr:hypothetical protein [Paraburkholderia sp. BL6669N2]REG45474.1 hypothetical protein B0G80_9070 [Paraburkholderia sp. BL6669N2]